MSENDKKIMAEKSEEKVKIIVNEPKKCMRKKRKKGHRQKNQSVRIRI